MSGPVLRDEILGSEQNQLLDISNLTFRKEIWELEIKWKIWNTSMENAMKEAKVVLSDKGSKEVGPEVRVAPC